MLNFANSGFNFNATVPILFIVGFGVQNAKNIYYAAILVARFFSDYLLLRSVELFLEFHPFHFINDTLMAKQSNTEIKIFFILHILPRKHVFNKNRLMLSSWY